MNISYMGTKRELAPFVGAIARDLRPGAILDAFAGMCSVGIELASSRQVWTNDVQAFAFEVGSALFTSNSEPLNPVSASALLFDNVEQHRARLNEDFSGSVRAEELLVDSQSFEQFTMRRRRLALTMERELSSRRRTSFDLFTTTYADTYFGVAQSICLDAILFSIDRAYLNCQLDTEGVRWCKVALGSAMLRASNSTGHFAQFLTPKDGTYERFARLRRRSLWHEFLSVLDTIGPIGSSAWRSRNLAFNADCLGLLANLGDARVRPAIVYADPPYTNDQYSRFYHLFETLILYDYPEVTGAGRYRKTRFRTPFSLKQSASSALAQLARATAEIGADIVLSYPTNGLIYEAGEDPFEILSQVFPSVERRFAVDHLHSTFGASKGQVKANVVEQIFVGRLL